jgi:CheY-like chemotaxis protein
VFYEGQKLSCRPLVRIAPDTVLHRSATAARRSELRDMARRILVVDDQPSILETLTAILRSQQYEVTTAKDGVEAFSTFENSTFDLVISDLKMPRMTGESLIASIRASSPSMPIVVLSSRYLENEVLADLYLEKGSSPVGKLLSAVAALVNHGE